MQRCRYSKENLEYPWFCPGTYHKLWYCAPFPLLFYASASHQTAPYVKETSNKLCPYIEVDLNLDILWGESTQKSDMDFILQNTMFTEICGTTIRKLTPEMEFIALCLHHYKDMNSIYLLSQGSLNLRLFFDIYFYIKNCSIDFDKLLDLCKKLDVDKYVFYCLYYTNFIFEDSILEPYCQAMCSEDALNLLNTFGLSDNEYQEWHIDFLERLFDVDIEEYFQNALPGNLLSKIEVNQKYLTPH